MQFCSVSGCENNPRHAFCKSAAYRLLVSQWHMQYPRLGCYWQRKCGM